MATKKTTPRKSTSPARAKTGTSKATTAKTAAKPAAAKAPAAAKPASVQGVSLAEALPEAARTPLKKKDLFARVKARSTGVKGSEVRVVLDAVLEELGTILTEGDTLNAQPLGSLRVQKRRETDGAQVVVCKLRRKKPGGGGKDPLAEAAE